MDIQEYVRDLASRAKAAARELAVASSAQKDAALLAMADGIEARADERRTENARDLEAARAAGLSAAMLDRLELTGKRIAGMADGLRQVAALPDPVGEIIRGWTRPNGLRIAKVRVPLGTIAIIYESRPNVTADAAGLCIKAGNGVVLRGGKEAIRSNTAIWRVLQDGLAAAGLPADAIGLVETTDRSAIDALIRADDLMDVIIPRGGEGLIRRVVQGATVPVVKHYKGVCHVYVDASADLAMAQAICLNAKCQRPGVCNAMETLLIHRDIAREFLERLRPVLEREGVELRGCETSCQLMPDVRHATLQDWTTEYLDLILNVRIVRGIDEAIEHINRFGSGHSDAIVTGDFRNAERFVDEVDSATVFVNTSTRFNDGEQLGLGAEIGISTDRLHARGPMGLEELTTYKWRIIGNGQLRT